MPSRFAARFPVFARQLESGLGEPLEEVLPPLADSEIEDLERQLAVPLPGSYKNFLRCARGLWLMGGVVQMSKGHPFFHDFPKLEELTQQQRDMVAMKGGDWPPPSQGMLCFAEFFMMADGDQVLFDVSGGLVNGEYPVLYYDHESRPPTVRKLADSFDQWLNEFLEYDEFEGED